MNHVPLISICIPAYKRDDFLRRLLDSVKIQSFKSYEVIITDDSPDDSIKKLCETYTGLIPIRYSRNDKALGTPENWNEAIRKANGKWIKLMHDDDWFSDEKSLQYFADIALKDPGSSFIISAYRNIHSGTGEQKQVYVSTYRWRALLKDPVTLLSKNIIGPPSVTMHPNRKNFSYDTRLQWLVDMDFYIRILSELQPVYINKPLVNIGINDQQVTKYSSRVREVEIPEHFHVLEKTGEKHLSNLMVYDAWWRLIRNLSIKNENDIRAAGYQGPIAESIKKIIRFQSTIPSATLKIGGLSKSLMILCYTKNSASRLR